MTGQPAGDGVALVAVAVCTYNRIFLRNQQPLLSTTTLHGGNGFSPIQVAMKRSLTMISCVIGHVKSKGASIGAAVSLL